MSKFIRRLTAVSLTLSMILTCVPIVAFAKQADSSAAPSVEQPANPTEIIELEEKRDTFSKHFRMSDGSMQAVSYEMPIHFQDENGIWQEYDNTLTETNALPDDGESKTEKDYVNTKSDFSVRLSKKTNGKKFVRLEIDGYKISWYYKNAKKQTGVVTEKQVDNDPTTLENINTEVLYRNIYSGVDLQYIVSSNHLKENLILANENTVKTFTAEYKIGELVAVSVDDRTIEFRKENGEAVYTLNAPYMSDAEGKTCTDITLQIVSQKNSKVTIQTVLNEPWLKDEERQFPVTVDPVITGSRDWKELTNCEDAYIASDMPNACFGINGNSYEGSLHVGQTNDRGRTRALLQIPILPNIGVGSKVIDARVSFLVRECYPEIRMDLYRVTSPWQYNTVCWNSGVTTDWQILDYQIVPITYRNDTNVERWQTFEITDLVRGWYSGEYPNYGICLISESEWSSSQARAWMYSNGYPDNQAVRPIVQISYRNMSGYEDYWTYTSLPAGRDGLASVNNYNGNFVFSQPLFNDDNTLLMPVNLSLIYNQNKTGLDHGGYIGNHFQTNYHVSVAYDASTASLGYKYYLNDADGTKHWFYFEDGSSEGKDEDGLSYKMTVNESISSDDRTAYKFTVTDKAKNKMYFNGLGLLMCIENANGNKALVSYNAQNCIQTITNGSGQVYTFSYGLESDRSKITSLTNPAGATITFEYDGSNNLTRVYFPDEILHLWRDGNNSLYKIHFGYENVINIQYDTSPQQRVNYIDLQSSDGGVMLDRYWFDYRQNATNVTDKLNRLFTYQFNDYGQTTGIVSGESGEVQTWQYEPGNTTSAKANKIISQSRVFSGTENLITDPMIERDFAQSYDVYYTEDAAGGCYAVRNASMGHYNNGCMEIHKEQMAGTIFAYQECTVSPGTYTLSCYVNTNGAEMSGLGAALELDAWNNGQFESYVISERIKSTNGWERISTTIEIEETRTLRSLFALDSYTAGTLYVDDIQLEKSAGETSFNLVENSAFANGLSGWKTGGDWPTLGFNPNSSTLNCTDCARFSGDIGDNCRNLYRSINISGKANDTFSFGAWVYAQSVPVDNGTKDQDRYQPMFEVLIEYYDMNGNFGGAIRQTANADLYHAWQFVSGKAVIPIDYSELLIVCWYSHNANDCFFTDAFCYKEPYDSTLSYDNNGNVVFNTDIQSATCKYAYEDNNIAKITTPTGSRMFYSYDNEQTKLLYSLSSDGTQNRYSYDNNGNLTQTTLKSRRPATALEDGKTYFIFNAYSGQLIDSGLNPATIPVTVYRFDENTLYQQWKLEAVPGQENVYRIRSMAYDGHYLGVETNSAENGLNFYVIPNSPQNFKIIKEKDNTYSIFTSVSNYEKCLDPQYYAGEKVIRSECVRQATYYPEAENMHWYFYPVECDDVNTITTCTSYTENGAYPASTTDSRGFTTTYSYNQTKHVLDSTTNAAGAETSYTYEENTNRLKTVSGGGVTIRYAYNGNRLLSDINANNGTRYHLVYDNADRLSQTKVGNGTDFITLSTNEYGENNLLKKQTYGNGAYFENSYDRLDRLAGITYNGSTTGVQYQYNSAGLLSSVKDYTVSRYVKNSYDTLGRVQKTATYPTPEMRKSMLSSASYRYEDRTGRLSGYTYTTLKTENDYKSLDFGIVYGNSTDNERIKKLTLNGQDSLGYEYDAFGRLAKLNFLGVSSSPSSIYTYVTNTQTHKTSLLVQSVTNPVLGEISYTYDALGNITEIRKNGELFASYTYDNLNQLSSVTVDGVTTSYTYNNGNIVSQTVNGEITKSYGYTDPTWADLLTEYNGQTITYDAIGNPLQYRDGLTMTWQNGRQLASITKTDLSASFSYGMDGIRTAKTINGTTTEYYWQNGILQGQRTGNDSILFLYNANGAAYGMICKTGETESTYYYLFNAQGDVIALLDSTGNCVAEYAYDEWGKLLTITGSQADTTGLLNPIRYRGYYYDSETGFYYLQSRYYDPETGRFINADKAISSVGGDISGYNMFAYCMNNPINMSDESGNWPQWVKNAWNTVVNGTKKILKKTTSAIEESFQFEVGFGVGIGASATINGVKAQASAYRDSITLGVKNGAEYTADKASAALSIKATEQINAGIACEYEHRYETDYKRICYKHGTDSTVWSVYNCPSTTRNYQMTTMINNNINMNHSSSENFIGVSAELHVLVGGHFTLGFDANRFIQVFSETE